MHRTSNAEKNIKGVPFVQSRYFRFLDTSC